MNNQGNWKATKFSLIDGRLHVNRKKQGVHPKSWIVTESVARLYEKYLPQYMKGQVLDLGCGMCPLYGFYKEFSSSVFCVDWGNSLHMNPYNDITCDISQAIPLCDGLFDTIILSDVLEHIPNPIDLLREAHRLLRNKGILIFNVPFMYWIHEEPYDFYRYTEFAIEKHVRTADFQIEVLEIVGGILESWADLTLKLISYFPLRNNFFAYLLYKLVFLSKSIPFIKLKFSHLDRRFPTGYFVVVRKS